MGASLKIASSALSAAELNKKTGRAAATASSEKNEKTRRFTKQHTPPKASTDPSFRLEDTTISVQLRAGQRVQDLANALLDFMGNNSRTMKIEKVRPEKYTLTFNVYLNSEMTKMKIRIYSLEGDCKYAVEMQKRCGDVITFSSTFQHVQLFLQEKFKVVSEVGDDTHPPPVLDFSPEFPSFGTDDVFKRIDPPSPCEGFGDILMEENLFVQPSPYEALQPVIDMANRTSQPSFQAEAAQAFVEVTEPGGELDLDAAAVLCTAEVFRALLALQSTSFFSLEVSFPTDRLLRNLAKTPEASKLFVEYFPEYLNE